MLRQGVLRAHIVAFCTAIGAELVLLGFGIVTLNGTPVSSVLPAVALVAGLIVRPAAVVVLASGVYLALTNLHGARQAWIVAKLIIILALIGALFFSLVPSLERALRDGVAVSPVSLVVAPFVALVLLSVAVFLGLFKPSGRSSHQKPGQNMHMQQKKRDR